MSAIKISQVDGKCIVEYEEPTPTSQKERLNELYGKLGENWYAVAAIFELAPNDNGVRLLKRWSAGIEKPKYFREMPKSQWKVLLMILDGQDVLEP